MNPLINILEEHDIINNTRVMLIRNHNYIENINDNVRVLHNIYCNGRHLFIES